MRLTEREQFYLLDHLYGAASDPAEWNSFLEILVPRMAASSIALHFYNPKSPSGRVETAIGVDARAQAAYASYYASLNPWVRRGVPAGAYRPGAVLAGEWLVSEGEFERTEFCNDFALREGFFYSGGLVLAREEQHISILSVQRARRSGPFSKEDIQLFSWLNPHLQQVLQLHGRLVEARSRSKALVEVLEHVQTGILLLDESGKVVALNGKARAILASGDGLTLTRSGLRAASAAEDQALQKLIRNAGSTTLAAGMSAGGAVTLSRPSRRRPLEVLVAPLPRQDAVETPGRPVSVVFMSDPEHVPELQTETLSRLHGLTRAESRLALELLGGSNPRDAADRLEISAGTARNQLKSIFLKTETRGQSELIRLLVTCLAAQQLQKAQDERVACP
jgi:DNA-binding CsgD family transcriptional regulator